jgi:hypothetical protein
MSTKGEKRSRNLPTAKEALPARRDCLNKIAGELLEYRKTQGVDDKMATANTKFETVARTLLNVAVNEMHRHTEAVKRVNDIRALNRKALKDAERVAKESGKEVEKPKMVPVSGGSVADSHRSLGVATQLLKELIKEFPTLDVKGVAKELDERITRNAERKRPEAGIKKKTPAKVAEKKTKKAVEKASKASAFDDEDDDGGYN